jgi:hypothetical protein
MNSCNYRTEYFDVVMFHNCRMTIRLLDVAVHWLELLIRIREIQYSYIDPETNHGYRVFLWFSKTPPGNFGIES